MNFLIGYALFLVAFSRSTYSLVQCRYVLCVSVKDDDTCLICETVVQYIEAMLDDKTSVDEIKKLLDKVCNFLPDSMKSQVILIMLIFSVNQIISL